MKHLSDYAAALAPFLISAEIGANPEIVSVTNDSRQAAPGVLFCAIRGAKNDGHQYLSSVADKGVSAVIVSANWQGEVPPVPVLRVRDSYFAWSVVCETWADYPAHSFRVHTVTGTNGKTSTAYFMRHFLQSLPAAKTALISTVSNDSGNGAVPAERTTPDALSLQKLFCEMKRNSVTDAVMESSSHGLHQHRSGTLKFASACFTNLTGDHLDYHGDMEHYYLAKRILFDELVAENAPCVLNIDDPYGARMFRELQPRSCGRILGISFSGQSAFSSLKKMQMDSSGSNLELMIDGDRFDFRLPLVGGFNAANACLAMTAACALGIPRETLLQRAETLPHVPGRLQLVRLANGASAFVDYAHTDDALIRVLASLRAILPSGGKIVTVFGCGGDRDRTKRPRMGAAVGKYSDLAVVTSDNPRTEDPDFIIREILPGFPSGYPYEVMPDRAAAIAKGVSMVSSSDILLVAGKGHEDYQEICGIKHHFSDAEELFRFS